MPIRYHCCVSGLGARIQIVHALPAHRKSIRFFVNGFSLVISDVFTLCSLAIESASFTHTRLSLLEGNSIVHFPTGCARVRLKSAFSSTQRVCTPSDGNVVNDEKRIRDRSAFFWSCVTGRTEQAPPAFVALGRLFLALSKEELHIGRDLRAEVPMVVKLLLYGLVRAKPDGTWSNRYA